MKNIFKIVWTALTWSEVAGWSKQLQNRSDVEYDRAKYRIYRKNIHSKRLRVIEIRDILER